MSEKYTLGINSAYHEPAVAVAQDGKIIKAVEEERFNRKKHGKSALVTNADELPFRSLDYCLEGLHGEISAIGDSFDPIQRYVRNVGLEADVTDGDWGSQTGERTFYEGLQRTPVILEETYGLPRNRFNWIPHQMSHAASAFYPSPFEDAAILTTDGIGEFGSIALAHGKGNQISLINEEGEYPNSIGFLWTKASSFLSFLLDGMPEYGAGTVMALASYGDSNRFYSKFREFVNYDDEGRISVDGKVLQFRNGSHDRYENLFGIKSRGKDETITQDHMDFAAGLQKVTNEVLLGLARRIHKLTGSKNLCRAGGVALNCTSNTYLLENSPFEKIYVFPGANDMGTAVGAALYSYFNFCGGQNRVALDTPYLGPEYSSREIKTGLEAKNTDIDFIKVPDIEKTTAYLLSQGSIVAWFQDRMEFGPRALGNRSILADPQRSDMLTRVSQQIKGREWFRPLAPMVLEESVDEWFVRPNGGSTSDQWMLFSYEVQPSKIGRIPAVTHYDNTGRVQTVNQQSNERLHRLLRHFDEYTAVPVLVNTSFNIKEPIVCTPEEAVDTYLRSWQQGEGIDFLSIGDYLVTRKNPHDLGRIARMALPLKTVSEHLR